MGGQAQACVEGRSNGLPVMMPNPWVFLPHLFPSGKGRGMVMPDLGCAGYPTRAFSHYFIFLIKNLVQSIDFPTLVVFNKLCLFYVVPSFQEITANLLS